MTTQLVTAAHPTPARRHPSRLSRWQVVIFVILAYGLSWWPMVARLANPGSAAMFAIGPSIAALIVVGWVSGRPGLRALLRSTVHARIGRWWWSVTIPLAVAAATAALTVLSGAAAPAGYDVGMAAVAMLASLPIFLVTNGPLGEELGWRGYLLPRFLRRHPPITATLMLIPFWIGFHLPMIVTSPDRFGVPWVLMVVGLAFTMTWLYLRSGGSVLLAIVFHAVVNVSAPAVVQLFGDGDRTIAIRLMAALWLLIGTAVIAGPLRRRGRPATADAPTATDDRYAR